MNREDVIREIQSRYRQSSQSDQNVDQGNLTGLPRHLEAVAHDKPPVAAFNELQRRHWAAMEAIRLGRGGITLVSKALRISPNTIKKGIQEIATGQADSYLLTKSRIRKPGGGRKSKNASTERPTRTGSKKTCAYPEPQFQVSDGLTQNRIEASPCLDEKSVIDKASDQRPNETEIG